MKILTWNIRQGGSKQRLAPIINTLISHNPDVLVLTEFWDGRKGDFIGGHLRDAGWEHQLTSNPSPRTNGLFIASKWGISPCKQSVVPTEGHRWMEFDVNGLRILAVHIPLGPTKPLFWDKIVERAEQLVAGPALIIGDFNTGLPEDAQGAPFKCVESMQQVLDMGWYDAWRLANGSEQEFSWYSSAENGFRIDHAFVSAASKDRVRHCAYSHQERRLGYSDHSALMIDLAI